MTHPRYVALLCAAVLGVTGLSATTTAGAATRVVRPCSSGLVALTFDDGPASAVTPRLLSMLKDRRVPATFFVVGERVDAAPKLTRAISRAGFTLGNHTYRHEQLTLLSDGAIRSTLVRARRSIKNSGAKLSHLMRPPYGSTNSRVESVVSGLGLVSVLWTVDPRDWTGISTGAIASSVLAQLRPHETNIVLQHDGVRNSPNSVSAVPRIIRTARDRGYCFASLGPHGKPLPPVPSVSVSNALVRERDSATSALSFRVRLDRPTSRPTSVLVRTAPANASSGVDFAARRFRLRFPAGATLAEVNVKIFGDRTDEATERLHVKLSDGRGMTIADASGRGTILDNDPPPNVDVKDAQVIEPATGATSAQVPVKLARPSGRYVRVEVETVAGSATKEDFTPVSTTLVFRPGEVMKTVEIPVLADAVDEEIEQFRMRIVSTRNGEVRDRSGTISITPP